MKIEDYVKETQCLAIKHPNANILFECSELDSIEKGESIIVALDRYFSHNFDYTYDEATNTIRLSGRKYEKFY